MEKYTKETKQVTGTGTVSKMKMHIFFAVSTLFFLAVILLVAGFRIDWYVNAQKNNNQLTEVNLAVNNESNIKPVKATKTADLSSTEVPEMTATPVPTAVITPTPVASAQSAKNIPVFFLSQVSDDEIKQGKGFRMIIVQDASGNQQSVDMAPNCSIKSARFSHDYHQLAFICEQFMKDPAAGYINNIYIYDLEGKKTAQLTDNKFPAGNQNTDSCNTGESASGPYFDDMVLLWNQDDTRLLVKKITPNACSDSNGIAVEEVTLQDKHTAVIYNNDSESLGSDRITGVTYTIDYQGIYIFSADGAGNVQVQKIALTK